MKFNLTIKKGSRKIKTEKAEFRKIKTEKTEFRKKIKWNLGKNKMDFIGPYILLGMLNCSVISFSNVYKPTVLFIFCL